MLTATKNLKTDTETKMTRIKQGYQRNKVILTLNNSELDALEDVVDSYFWPNEPEGKKHILQQIQNARREAQ
jgi:hypothetical protein